MRHGKFLDFRLQNALQATAVTMRAAQIEHLLRKAGFRPDQARVPAGTSEGGQWTDEGGGNEDDLDLIVVGSNPDDLSELPDNPPPRAKERNIWAVRVARAVWLAGTVYRTDRIARWV